METITNENIFELMNSVVSVSVDLYPKSYDTDANFVQTLKPFLKDRKLSLRKKVLKFQLSFNNAIKCIAERYGTTEYINKFKSDFDLFDGVSKNYERLIENYSSPEILMLFRFFPNFVYFDVTIHNVPDTRSVRDNYAVCLKLPDMKINMITLKLRNYCTQKTVDMINKFIISKSLFDGNAMSKRNMFMINTPAELLALLTDVYAYNEGDKELAELIDSFGFLSINEINNVGVLVQTDWPIL